MAEVQQAGLLALQQTMTAGLSEIASAIEWGFGEIGWQLQLQTDVLRSIDQTLKTPGETQANEWRQMGEELRRRGVLDESEEFYIKALERNRLDYRIYIGLAETYLQSNQFDKARTVLERSLPHAPKREIDYKSYSYRLIGHIYACEEDYPNAVSLLRTAVELSPRYEEGSYDYSQYCARMGHTAQCLASLRQVILANPLYWYLAQHERNFDPCRREVGELLSSLRRAASHSATDAIARAESVLQKTNQPIAAAMQALSEVRDKETLTSQTQRKSAEEKLKLAENKVASGDYRAFLEAEEIAHESYALANSAIAKAHEERQRLEAKAHEERQRLEELRRYKVRQAWGTVPTSIRLSLASGFFGWLLVGFGGFVLRAGSDFSPYRLDMLKHGLWSLGAFIEVGVVGLVIGVIGGMLYGCYAFAKELK